MAKRCLTALVLFASVFFCINTGGIPLLLFITLIALLINYEIVKILKKKWKSPLIYLSYPLSTLILLSPLSQFGAGLWNNKFTHIFTLFFILNTLIELFVKRIYLPKNPILLAIRIALTSALCLPYILLIRTSPNGVEWTWIILLCIWNTDSFALFGGKKFGKTKLTKISPNKTIEGTLFGIAASTLIAVIGASFIHYNPIKAIFIGILIAILAQLGDLHESLFKRQVNIKDSSSLLPGHGGFYDRADSTLYVLPIIYILVLYLR